MTMIDTLYDNHYKSREKLAWEFAKILNQEAKELEAAGLILFSSMSRPLTSSSMRSTTGGSPP
ncbi:5-methyltetrahydropteroyltriglutamate-homocysteine methyltransferase [Klebsiella pneumoniae]|nr:5-methyltetrahydropteroyltriglutamate-homocysteine methyltransferase [Klebsiella pneumoniae]